MKSRSLIRSNSLPGQQGMTLVELMVGLAIGLVLSIASAALYLAASENARSLKANTDIDETGLLALEAIGREIQKAGFYPAQYSTDTSANYSGEFFNGKPGAKTVFNYAVFGCDNAKYDPINKVCGAPVVGDPDSIIINYFSTPEFGTNSLFGNANDCNKKPVSGDTDNALKSAAGKPMFVSNRFGLTDPQTFIDANKNSITTRSLGCHGNGNEGATTMEPHYKGIDEMVIRYGLSTNGALQSPNKFLTAAQVSVSPNVASTEPWKRVVAVKICAIIHTLENSKTEDKAGYVKTYEDCQGVTQTPPAGNKFLYKRFQRVFAVRSNINGIRQ
jgi:type IV pilus assembly protein PilW